MNRENLTKLADWVEKNVTQDQFDMRFYRSQREIGSSERQVNRIFVYGSESCGTHGCLLGWAPFVPGLEPSQETQKKSISFCFTSYCEETFKISTIDGFDDEWTYLFSNDWIDYDNTVTGAVARIRKLISGEKVVLPWEKDGEE